MVTENKDNVGNEMAELSEVSDPLSVQVELEEKGGVNLPTTAHNPISSPKMSHTSAEGVMFSNSKGQRQNFSDRVRYDNAFSDNHVDDRRPIMLTPLIPREKQRSGTIVSQVGVSYWLIYTIISIVLLLFGTILGLSIYVSQIGEASSDESLCSTDECITLAADFLSRIDDNVDPCENFYYYACGKWIENNPVPEDKTRWMSFYTVDKYNTQVVKAALTELNNTIDSIWTNASWLYSTCVDTDTLDTTDLNSTILSLLNEINFTNDDDNAWNDDLVNALQDAVIYSLSIGASPFFSLGIEADIFNSSWNIAYISQGGVGMTQSYYNATGLDNEVDEVSIYGHARFRSKRLTPRVVLGSQYGTVQLDKDELQQRYTMGSEMKDAYSEYIKTTFDLLQIAGLEMEDNPGTVAANVLDFETRLVAAYEPYYPITETEYWYNLFHSNEFGALSDWIDWGRVVNASLNGRLGNESVVVENVKYLANISILLENTEPKVVVEYLWWTIMRGWNLHLTEDFRGAYYDYAKALTGLSREPARGDVCVDVANSYVGLITGAFYVEETFPASTKTKVQEMIENIIDTFIQNIQELGWMSTTTKSEAIRKANSINVKIGYPEIIMDEDGLEEWYKDLEVVPTEWFSTVLNWRIWDQRQYVARFGKLKDVSRWEMYPSEVNAYYQPTSNEIVFPAGIFQDPFYKSGTMEAVIYGGIGVVIGHEISHGFDDSGSHFDQVGNLEDWWTEADLDEFDRRTRCIANQYAEYEVNGEHLNGNMTLGENIADNGGVHVSLMAYLASQTENELPLIGLEMTPEQMFFLGHARVWCATITDEKVHQQILTDPHSPSDFRVIGPLSNSEAFAEAFSCPAGSEMNPKTKCEVW